jgi:DNA-binding transcriptional MerR regulator
MNYFSIAQLEQFSGIKAHTIRIWEQRYQALSPNRSQGNTRSYDNIQLKRLLNIVSLMESDYKISELCSKTDKDLIKLLDKQLQTSTSIDETSEYFITQLITAGVNFDDTHFDKIFSNCLLRYGMKDTYSKVLYPMLVRIGLMWSTDEFPTAPEHFISNMLRQKLFTAIDSLPPAKENKKSWLLFLPENEFHEIGLLFSHYLIRQAGKKVIYLGANVPLETISKAVKDTGANHLLFFFVHHNKKEDAQHYLNALKKNCKSTHIHIAGREKLLSTLQMGKEINWIHSAAELEHYAAK